MTNAGEICTREVVVVTRNTDVAEAAQLMRRYHVGTLVVCEQPAGDTRKPVGIVTDRDIVIGVIAQGLQADAVTVGDIMVRDLITAGEAQGVRETLEIMRQRGIRRLPVVGADGRLVGLIAMDDILEILAEDLTDIARVIARGRKRETATRT